MRAISGLIASVQGAIVFEGQDITRASADRRRRLGIGHVPQGDLLFSDMTVLENLAAGAYGGAWWTRRQRTAEIFSLFPELAARQRVPAGGLAVSGACLPLLAQPWRRHGCSRRRAIYRVGTIGD